jgi:hypothetical protein
MALQVFVLLLVVCFLLCLALRWRLGWFPLRTSSSKGGARRTTVQRLLKPRSPADCPACCLSASASAGADPSPRPVRPWSEVKSRRGAPKRVNTEGFACPNPQCTYYGIADSQIHALVGDGSHGQAERIQTFRCQACRTTITSRRNTPLYRLKTPAHQVAMVLSALAEGLDPSAAERVFGFRQDTIATWLSRAGKHAQILHERSFYHLHLPHLQLDELRTRLRCATQVLWLWLAIDPLSKIIPVLHLGSRTQTSAHTVIHSLRQILAPGCLPLFTSDGLNLYFYALTAHFGHWLQMTRRGRRILRWQVAEGLIYGQVKKSYQRRRLVRVTHVMRLGTGTALKIALQGLGFTGRLNTLRSDGLIMAWLSSPEKQQSRRVLKRSDLLLFREMTQEPAQRVAPCAVPGTYPISSERMSEVASTGVAEVLGLISTGLLVYLLWKRRAGFTLILIAAICFAGMLALFALGNNPLNQQIASWTPETLSANWREVRNAWDGFHAASSALAALALTSLLIATLSNTSSSGLPTKGSQRADHRKERDL